MPKNLNILPNPALKLEITDCALLEGNVEEWIVCCSQDRLTLKTQQFSGRADFFMLGLVSLRHGTIGLHPAPSVKDVTLRLVRPDERRRWDATMVEQHYLGFWQFSGHGLLCGRIREAL